MPDEFFDPALDREIEELFYADDSTLSEALDALARAQTGNEPVR